MNTQHTPGPWRIGEKHPGRVLAARRVIAYCTPHPDDTDSPSEEEAANAALIASAPDMAAELERLRQRVQELEGATAKPAKRRTT